MAKVKRHNWVLLCAVPNDGFETEDKWHWCSRCGTIRWSCEGASDQYNQPGLQKGGQILRNVLDESPKCVEVE